MGLWYFYYLTMLSHPELAPVARLDFVARGSRGPGWYVRYLVDGSPVTERLAIEIGADAFGAIEEAAEYLGCQVDQIEFGGPVWPKPLDGMVDAAGTLEYIAAQAAEAVEHDGEWQLLSQADREAEPDARRHERREAENVLLFGPVAGRVMNLSESGMGIEIHRPLRLATRDLFVTEHGDSKLELIGEVRWCRKVGSWNGDRPPIYHAGITIIR